jgi:hypothetical protein
MDAHKQGDALEALDTVARGCALHADKCVGSTADKWGAALDDYDLARCAVVAAFEQRASLLAALHELSAWVNRAIVPDYGPRKPMPENCRKALEASAAAIAKATQP